LRAHISGSFAVFSRDDGKEVTPKGRKARALLGYLISDPGAKIPKLHIIGLLWGDRGDALARASLRQALRELRLSINRSREIICSDREHIWICADSVIEDSAHELRGYKEAFQDLNGISAEFDEWLAEERSRRAKGRIATLRAEAEELLRAGRSGDSLELIYQMQIIDPHDEDALRLAMEAEFDLGHPAAIAERYRVTAALLGTDLGVRPSRESRALRDRLIRQLNARRRDELVHETDHEYFARRAREEREAAAQAENQDSRQVHETLADRYEEIAAPLIPPKAVD